ncbi:MAG: AzlD domain-containing protein [Lachnospiraceae bacterium]|nr:AzlD domain-containing protein [Lachnospiraceae bacterium]
MSGNIYIYIAVMAIVTYLIRVLPLTLIRSEIKNPFIRSFLYYVPYATLTAMTVPAIFTAAKSLYSGLAAFIVALFLSFLRRSLLTVAAGACLTVFLAEALIRAM